MQGVATAPCSATEMDVAGATTVSGSSIVLGGMFSRAANLIQIQIQSFAIVDYAPLVFFVC